MDMAVFHLLEVHISGVFSGVFVALYRRIEALGFHSAIIY